jgi:hypothetical protein
MSCIVLQPDSFIGPDGAAYTSGETLDVSPFLFCREGRVVGKLPPLALLRFSLTIYDVGTILDQR